MKIYKNKDKYIVYLPFEVIKQLGLQGEEEVDFFKFSDKAFLFAKKQDITNLLIGANQQQTAKAAPTPAPSANVKGSGTDLSEEEILVLKKLDTMRYSQRTVPNIAKLLSEVEKRTLESLIGKKAVTLYRDRKEPLYSITKDVYDRFLMRKKELIDKKPAPSQFVPKEAEAAPREIVKPRLWTVRAAGGIRNENIDKLEEQGFIVLQTEAEASSLSLALEDSVRHGLVLGTRSFNKKFYIIMRSFFDANSANVIKSLKDGPKSVDSLVKETGLDEDAIRSMLYLLSEQGDVSEKRRDVFALI